MRWPVLLPNLTQRIATTERMDGYPLCSVLRALVHGQNPKRKLSFRSITRPNRMLTLRLGLYKLPPTWEAQPSDSLVLHVENQVGEVALHHKKGRNS